MEYEVNILEKQVTVNYSTYTSFLLVDLTKSPHKDFFVYLPVHRSLKPKISSIQNLLLVSFIPSFLYFTSLFGMTSCMVPTSYWSRPFSLTLSFHLFSISTLSSGGFKLWSPDPLAIYSCPTVRHRFPPLPPFSFLYFKDFNLLQSILTPTSRIDL